MAHNCPRTLSEIRPDVSGLPAIATVATSYLPVTLPSLLVRKQVHATIFTGAGGLLQRFLLTSVLAENLVEYVHMC
jgi:hypothetical protein